MESLADARIQFEVNFWAPYVLMKEFNRQRASKESVIINILDYRIEKPSSNDGIYLITKDALRKLSELAALQWAPGTRVNAVAPAFVVPPRGMENSTMKQSLKKVPLGKPASAGAVASACIFLAETDSITGQTVFIDGGASI
jgi:NAD(P)-dependent dehydrogenase (short-subunit alcohol dehydrogenase family)